MRRRFARAGWVVTLLVVHGACEHQEPPPAPQPPPTWWEERFEPTWWTKGGKGPKEAVETSCEELAPGFATLRVRRLEAVSCCGGFLSDCNHAFTWLSWWQSQLFAKQIARMPGCSECDLDGIDGFTLVDSTLSLRVFPGDEGDASLRVFIDPRGPPRVEEVLIGELTFRLVRPGRAHEWRSLRSDCPDGTYDRRCYRIDPPIEEEIP